MTRASLSQAIQLLEEALAEEDGQKVREAYDILRQLRTLSSDVINELEGVRKEICELQQALQDPEEN